MNAKRLPSQLYHLDLHKIFYFSDTLRIQLPLLQWSQEPSMALQLKKEKWLVLIQDWFWYMAAVFCPSLQELKKKKNGFIQIESNRKVFPGWRVQERSSSLFSFQCIFKIGFDKNCFSNKSLKSFSNKWQWENRYTYIREFSFEGEWTMFMYEAMPLIVIIPVWIWNQ